MEEKIESELSSNNSEMKKSNNLPVIGFLVILAIVIASGVLKVNKKSSETSLPVEIQSTPTPTPAPIDVVNGEISVEAGSFYYKPNLIRVKKGEKVKLILNSVSMMHDFNIDELGVKVPITKSGSTSTVEFTPNQVGEFEFYCSVGQHRQNGQVGKLIVTE